VATRVGGNTEILEHGVTGLLVDSGRPQALVDAIRQLLDDPLLRETLTRNGRRRVLEAFTFEARMRKEERFYEDVLARRQRDRRVGEIQLLDD
jgi:glycosyltransferase involved in cell wall biosynthesis